MSKIRFQMTVRLPDEVRVALDRRVDELRARGAPVERASLAAHLLSTVVSGSTVDVEALEEVAGKLEAGAAHVRKRGSISGQAIEEMAVKLEDLAQAVRAVKGGA